MRKSLLSGILFIVIPFLSPAQNVTDTSKTLDEVVIRAFEQNRQLREAAVAINYINRTQLERFNNMSILPALNSSAGVRMEERSPGSYRMNVRGSTLRSPFGVRNIKIYWNGIPLTDPGGNTYLNQLGFNNIQSVEVIKGPGSSLYGAGTGGVMLINAQPEKWNPGVELGWITGSYGLSNLNIDLKAGSDSKRNGVNYTHQTSDGYRNHTNMRRDIIAWQTQMKSSERQQLGASVFYGDLYYQTPGGLTKTEYTANPRASRPAAGTLPSADQAHAAIYQKTFLAGITHNYYFTPQLQNNTVIYGAFSQIRNPTFRNYERRSEPHFGGRTSFTWVKNLQQGLLQFVAGGEGQRGFFNTKTFANVSGNTGAVMTDDEIHNWIYSFFVQGDLHWLQNWNLSAGVSINKSTIKITRLSVPLFKTVKKSYDSEWAPRLALSRKIFANCWVYASVSKGFSPPTVAEVLPSTSVISTTLQAEHGTSYEAGLKGTWGKGRLYTELNFFSYRLSNAIVVRKDASNADYYVNAGSTKQKGVETKISYQLVQSSKSFLSHASVFLSYTSDNFRYKEFKQGTADYSGKRLPSVAPNTIVSGLDVDTRPGIYMNFTCFYSDHIALNDANSEYARYYTLLGGRIGWRTSIHGKYQFNFFIGGDNLLDQRYSLGNDINATGGRYYNAASGDNYFAGVTLQWHAPRVVSH